MKQKLFKTFKQGFVMLSAICTFGFGMLQGTYAATSQSQSKPQTQNSLVALGDSITFGYNLQDTNQNLVPSKSAFPFLIGQKENLSVSDLGVPGWTTDDLVHALQTPDFIRAVRSASVITLDIGSNDLLHIAASQGLLNATAATSSASLTSAQKQVFVAAVTKINKNLETIVSEIQTQTKSPILFYNLYNPYPDETSIQNITNLFESAVNQDILQISKSTGNISVLNANQAFDHNQMTYVRVPEGDVHPTVLGQQELAKLGESTLTPLLTSLKEESGTVTSQMAGDIQTAGGTISASLSGMDNTFSVPSGALTSETRFSVMSTGLSGLSSIVPENEKIVAEAAVHFPIGVKLAKPYTLTIKNAGISSGAAVYQIEGNKFSLVPGAKSASGEVIIPSATEEDFVVVEPAVTAIAGATKPETGFPAFAYGAVAVALVGIGGSLIYASRRKREI
jgi:lysophospholipase L1-like esterase